MRKGAFAIAILLAPAVARADDDGDKVKVEVRGDADATLEEAVIAHYPDIEWEPVCTTPCTVHLPGDATVRVKGEGFPSEPVKLSHEDTILHAHVPTADTSATYTWIGSGVVALVYSAIAVPVGVGLWISEGLDFCFDLSGSCKPRDYTTADALMISGGISAAVGAILLGVGFHFQNAGRAKLSVSPRGASLMLAF